MIPRPNALTDTQTEARADRLVAWSARNAVLLLILPLLVYATLICFDPLARNYGMDVDVYQAAGEAVRNGDSLYEGPVTDLNYNYTPFAALPLVAMTVVPPEALHLLWFLINMTLLVYVIATALSMIGTRLGGRILRASIGLAGLMLWLQPVTWGMVLGQVNLVIASMVLWDGKNSPASGPHKWYRGILIGVATGIRLTPGLFIIYLLVIRRTRTALMACAGFFATVAVGFIALPHQSLWYWQGHFADVGHIDGDNHDRDVQSLAATMSRLLDRDQPPAVLWLVLACLLGAAGLAVAARAYRRGHTLLGLTLCGLTAEAVAPFSWSHHWVWLVPATLMVVSWAARGSRRRLHLTVVAVLVCLAAWPLGYLTHDRLGPILGTIALPLVSPFDIIYGNLYLWLYFGILIVAMSLGDRTAAKTPLSDSDRAARRAAPEDGIRS
ncbi:glycosyltransferase 87 family protein [Streptomyces sp. B3I8]|uniref:glycosyltransferase 87 family protein n=1 Tax=Streptomyces sp. B3I8 TaxID=3042303 RepID=UPI00278B8466|nr:glycosyltransferase 87 family protein [Streptomyces sp. B3I8]MDQ0790774.1 alpha-1,2-mannosyltransferase [Streptomyces sp. B3I8]